MACHPKLPGVPVGTCIPNQLQGVQVRQAIHAHCCSGVIGFGPAHGGMPGVPQIGSADAVPAKPLRVAAMATVAASNNRLALIMVDPLRIRGRRWISRRTSLVVVSSATSPPLGQPLAHAMMAGTCAGAVLAERVISIAAKRGWVVVRVPSLGPQRKCRRNFCSTWAPR